MAGCGLADCLLPIARAPAVLSKGPTIVYEETRPVELLPGRTFVAEIASTTKLAARTWLWCTLQGEPIDSDLDQQDPFG